MGARLNLLLDSNALYWWACESPSLSTAAIRTVRAPDAVVFVSVVTPWELAIKNKLGKIRCGPLLDHFESYVHEQGFVVLRIDVGHAIRAGSLPMHHRDPFDRMLIAQAQAEGLAIVSSDDIFEHYGVSRVW